MSTRQEILGRVREALSVPSNPRVKAEAGGGTRDAREAREFLPEGGATPEARLARFEELAAKLKATVVRFPDIAAAREAFAPLCEQQGWQAIASHHHPLTDALLETFPSVIWTEDKPGVDALEASSVAVTACEALIAQTGSVLVTSRGCGGRALSVLPPHHLVIATRDQLLRDMLDGFDLLRDRYGDILPGFISFITGASRTGDIERILVLGAHGPKTLTIWIVG